MIPGKHGERSNDAIRLSPVSTGSTRPAKIIFRSRHIAAIPANRQNRRRSHRRYHRLPNGANRRTMPVLTRRRSFNQEPTATARKLLGATAAGFPNFRRPGNIGLDFGHFAKTLCQAFQQFSMKGRFGRGKSVVAPKPRLPNLDQPGFSQVGQVPRNARLRRLQYLDNIAHAPFPVQKNMKYPQPRSVGKRAKHQVDAAGQFVLRGFCHIKNRKVPSSL